MGCAVGQMIASLPLGLTSEFGLLGWVFVVLACGAAVLSTLLVASATALVRHAGRPRPSCED